MSTPQYVQAWKVESDEGFNGLVYDQSIALDKYASSKGARLTIMTIVRHVDGTREYLPGTIASEVERYREGRIAS